MQGQERYAGLTPSSSLNIERKKKLNLLQFNVLKLTRKIKNRKIEV